MSFGYGYIIGYGFGGDIGSVTPPDTSDIVYNLTEELRTDTGYEYVTDSIGDDTNGYLEESNGDAYNPNIAQYPLDGTIDLSSGQVINTRTTLDDVEQTFLYSYAVSSGTFSLLAVHYKGDGLIQI